MGADEKLGLLNIIKIIGRALIRQLAEKRQVRVTYDFDYIQAYAEQMLIDEKPG